MEINHYKIKTPEIASPGPEWKQCWHGLYRLSECWSESAYSKFKKNEDKLHKIGFIGEKEAEVDLFLSILQSIKSEQVVFMELGAGFADWCLALNGVVNNNIIPIIPKQVTCYAVEAEPTHFNWSFKHFVKWNINGEVIPSVISDKEGQVEFSIDKDPASNYGQSVTFNSNPIRAASNILRRKSITVNSTTIDKIIESRKLSKVDLIDMDIQGNEIKAINGAMKSIKENKIDYIKIGTHDNKCNEEILGKLNPYFNNIVDIYPFSVGTINGMITKVNDGIQLYERKGIC